MTTHVLKCWPEYYDAISEGKKRFEIRREDDRKFAVGDLLVLKEWDPNTQEHLGHSYIVEVTYIVRGPAWGIPEGLVVMSIV